MEFMSRDQPRKKLITLSISLLIASLSISANAKTIRENFLDLAVSEKVVDGNACFKSSPLAIFEVEPSISNGKRVYKVTQSSGSNVEQAIYAKPLEEQIKDHKIVGRVFCKGVVSISDMDLPFSKADGINDANDGVVLLENMQSKIEPVVNQLNVLTKLAIRASSGTYSSTELADLNREFAAYIAELNTIVANSYFNNIQLFDGSTNALNVPVNRGKNVSRMLMRVLY